MQLSELIIPILNGDTENIQQSVDMLQLPLDINIPIYGPINLAIRPLEAIKEMCDTVEDVNVMRTITGGFPGIIVDLNILDIGLLSIIKAFITFNPEDGVIVIIRAIGSNIPINPIQLDSICSDIVNIFIEDISNICDIHILSWSDLKNMYNRMVKDREIQRFNGHAEKVERNFASIEDLL